MIRTRSKQRGFSFAELILSIALVTLLFGLVAQINVTISNAVFRNELHMTASEELDNIIEQLAAIPYDEITPETANRTDIIRTQNRVVAWTLSLSATETSNVVKTKRIVVALTSPKTQQVRVQRVFWKSNPIRDAAREYAE